MAENTLHTLARLVGTWAIDGPGLSGTVTYTWMDGGGFLVQQVDLVNATEVTKGVEYIGFDARSGLLRSHYFGGDGAILEYVYELDGDDLTIWFGEPGSPAKFTGRFVDDGRRNSGAWVWPGGGYVSNMTRVEGR
ncbi:hypothetical protein OIE66_23755 [Nonomuraea sp. NBC_01738]|uniref:hypothetical protein n=1 Tax=Nonomuraea sp. NBC_01738 TaxID=2976003 RepID=UPI002E131879|nr:hypothetical protein OIE66_23755 [Nonomuraea sp. NBC_01738]